MKYLKVKRLMFGLKQHGGRSYNGQITTPRRGSLTKRVYRYLDIKRRLWSQEGAVILYKYVYDPNRSSYISLIMLPNGIMTYILAGEYASNQKRIYNLSNIQSNTIGYSQILKNLKNGMIVFNSEMTTGYGTQLLRAAGSSGLILKKYRHYNSRIVMKLKSGALRAISSNAIACVGIASNQNHFLINYKKAGKTRLKGKRPYTRPSAMNPVDHPMGGRTKGGIHPQNKNKILKGTPTAKKKKLNHLEIISTRVRRLKKRRL